MPLNSRVNNIKFIGSVIEATTELNIYKSRKIGVEVIRRNVSVCHRLPWNLKDLMTVTTLMIYEDFISAKCEEKQDGTVKRLFTRSYMFHYILSESGGRGKTFDNPNHLFRRLERREEAFVVISWFHSTTMPYRIPTASAVSEILLNATRILYHTTFSLEV